MSTSGGRVIWTWLACSLDPGRIDVDTTELDLGQVELGQRAARTVTLSHRGEAPVELRAVTDAPFGLGELPTQLEQGDTFELEVTLVGGLAGVHEGELRLRYDDEGGAVHVALSGEVLAPGPAVEPTSLSLAAHPDATASFVLSNGGDGHLAATLELEGESGLELSTDSVELPAGEQVTVTVSNAQTPGAVDRVVVHTNATWDDRLEVTVAVDAVGLELLAPATGDSFLLADTPTLSAQVVADEPLGSVEVSWSSDLDGELGSAWSDDEGVSELEVGLSEGWHELTAVASSSTGSASASVVVEVACGTDDVDGDGTSECEGDCWPRDADWGPGGDEICEDGIDQDCDGEDKTCRLEFEGIQTDMGLGELEGWEVCYSDTYGDSGTALTQLQFHCSGEFVMYACGTAGTDHYDVLAYAHRDIVFTDNGEANDGTVGNGAAWYLGTDESIGFFEPGDGVTRNSCDTSSGSYPDHRLCWHTNNGSLSTGYRCGSTKSIYGSTYDRVVLHAD